MPNDMFSWRAMTAAINQITPAPRLLQDIVFKERNATAGEYIDIDLLVAGRKILPFVSDTSAGTVVDKAGKKVMSVKAPRLRPKVPFNAADLMKRGGGANFYGTSGDVTKYNKQRLGAELKKLKDNDIARTIEYMCATALTGKMEVRQDDIEFDIDYQIPTANKPDLSGAGGFNTADVDILGLLEAWADIITDAIGIGPDVCIVGKDAWKYMRTDTEVKAALDNRRINAGSLAWNVRSNYLGNLLGMELYRYGNRYTDLAGDDANFIADDACILICTEAVFKIDFGLILDLDAGAQVVAEYFSKSWIEKDPSVQWILAESRPVPIVGQPDALVYAKVITE